MILLDLHKDYNDLNRSRCLGILEGYCVGPRDLCLLRQYWAMMRMVARVGGYYGAPFRRERGVTQGDPLLPTIFNVVVYAVVCHWESLLVAEQDERERGEGSGDKGDRPQTSGRTIRDQYNGMQRVEEGHQWLTGKVAFLMPKMGWSLSRIQDGSSRRSIL